VSSTPDIRIGLIGAGRIGTFHAESLARRGPQARLANARNALAVAEAAIRSVCEHRPVPLSEVAPA
jgi:predicted dehydrogenase